jgi:hypothetical protein
MPTQARILFCVLFALILHPSAARSNGLELSNEHMRAVFGPSGLLAVSDRGTGADVALTQDAWQLTIGGSTLKSDTAQPTCARGTTGQIIYHFQVSGYQIRVDYRLKPGWRFVSKQISIEHAPGSAYVVDEVAPWIVTVSNPVVSDFVPSTYAPQLGASIEQSRARLPGRDFGEFLRFKDTGAMLVVQNPYLKVDRNGQSATVSYAPEMEWKQSWGEFQSDEASIGPYRLTGRRLPREMVLEWNLSPAQLPDGGMDEAEIAAFRRCVHAYLTNPAQNPISVEVGWTLNDYQIDVGTEEGRAEYKRIIDMAAQLGIQSLLYAPGNSKLADRALSADTWGWEYVLWLGFGQKIRKGEWDPESGAIPESVSTMLAYAKQKHVGLLAYVYPSIPYAKDPAWIVERESRRHGSDGAQYKYATLASREFQDYLIHLLVEFQKRTGIAGFSFDYTWLDLPGASSYTQWYGWRRVMETLREKDPSIVIDGRQSYQLYGPWSWLAGSYPHPTGNDEQPESFRPFPDLHFDRVSADRARFVNYWYRNYQFAPQEVIPGYATHQTERSREIRDAAGLHAEMMYSPYRRRDWDYLGFKYSFISSIATGGWNNVIDMIPARDIEESKNFSAADKAWIRSWLNWTVRNKELLRETRTIIGQPGLGRVDGTSAIVGDHGYIFLFNPNYQQLTAEFSLDQSIGVTKADNFLLKELYPQPGLLIGKPNSGSWSHSDAVQLKLDGTSATVLELVPLGKLGRPLILNAEAVDSNTPPAAEVDGSVLSIRHVAGEPGTAKEIGVLLPEDSRIASVTVNGTMQNFTQSGNYVSVQVRFKGERFAQAQEVSLALGDDGSLKGNFVVPQRVFAQLAKRKMDWPIPWTKEDYESTWLAPERLLLDVQIADAKDTLQATALLDGQPLSLTPAYSSSRTDPPCFVGFYADLSRIAPESKHTIELRIPKSALDRLQGVFFDNVLPQFTESIEN